MEPRDFELADLTEEELEELSTMEKRLAKREDRRIALVAYERKS